MSNIRIRKYETNGLGYIRAEIEWDAQTGVGGVTKNLDVPGGGIASLTANQEQYFLTLNIIPDDVPVPKFDSLRLPVTPGQPLLTRLGGCTMPSLFYDLPYFILPLYDTTHGLNLSAGIKPV